MRPIKITPPKKWLGNVRYCVLGLNGLEYVFAWTMDEVDAFLAQIAAERDPEPPPPQPIVGKFCAGCDRDLPLETGFHRRTTSSDGCERLCKRCASAAGRVAREKAAAGGKYAKNDY